MNRLPKAKTLGRRVFVALIAGELLFAIVLGLTISAFSVFSAAHQREEAIRQVSATIAAGLMPMIADQKTPQVKAQLSSILEAADVRDVRGICLVDGVGEEIVCQRGRTGVVDDPEPTPPPWTTLLEERVIVQPIVVDGLQVAAVRVRFAPPGLSSLVAPGIASAIVLLSVMLVSVPWTAWRLSRDVTEPLGDLERYAASIAEGDLDAPLMRAADGEIGELQETLRRMGQQLRERDEALQGTLGDLSEACESLERARQEIEQLSLVKSNFVAVAAHEIRSPLTTISLYAELLEKGDMGELDEQAREALSVIGAASSRLASITSDLMDSALLERGLMPISFTDVELGALVSAAVRDADLMAQTREMRVLVDAGLTDRVIRGDEVRLRQVLDNLLSNALKYSPNGTEVHVRSREVGDRVVLEVADRGRGIQPGGQSRLFALFGRLDFGDSRDTAGLGLGLAISARIVDAHGGHISYRPNEDGQGSIFTVTLPIASAAEQSPDRVEIRVSDSVGERESA